MAPVFPQTKPQVGVWSELPIPFSGLAFNLVAPPASCCMDTWFEARSWHCAKAFELANELGYLHQPSTFWQHQFTSSINSPDCAARRTSQLRKWLLQLAC